MIRYNLVRIQAGDVAICISMEQAQFAVRVMRQYKNSRISVVA